jgi:hypothetical protein
VGRCAAWPVARAEWKEEEDAGLDNKDADAIETWNTTRIFVPNRGLVLANGSLL